MTRFSAMSVLALLLFGTAFSTNVDMPEAMIDLRNSPSIRYNRTCEAVLLNSTTGALIPAKVASLSGAVTGLLTMYNSYYGCNATCVSRLSAALKTHYPERWAENSGFSSCVSRVTGGAVSISADTLAAVSYAYEVTRATLKVTSSARAAAAADDLEEPVRVNPIIGGCSGVLACTKSGNVLQGKNFDWEPRVGSLMPNILGDLSFEHNALSLHNFEVVDLLPSVFGPTVGVSEVFAVSANSRQFHLPLETILKCIEAAPTGLRHTAPSQHFTRWALETMRTYEGALSLFEHSNWCVPVYVVMSGTTVARSGAGAALVLGPPAAPVTKRTLDCSVAAQHAGKPTFLVQTNWDNKTHSLNNNNYYYDKRWEREEALLQSMSKSGAFETSKSTAAAVWSVLNDVGNTTLCENQPTGYYCLYGALLNSKYDRTVYSAVADSRCGSFVKKAIQKF